MRATADDQGGDVPSERLVYFVEQRVTTDPVVFVRLKPSAAQRPATCPVLAPFDTARRVAIGCKPMATDA